MNTRKAGTSFKKQLMKHMQRDSSERTLKAVGSLSTYISIVVLLHTSAVKKPGLLRVLKASEHGLE
jgi:hypothetical protein